jgi:hypothetical protein
VFFLAKSGFQNRLHFFSKVSASLVQAFSPGSFFLASLFFGKVSFQQRFWQVLGFGVLVIQSWFRWQSRACKKLCRV